MLVSMVLKVLHENSSLNNSSQVQYPSVPFSRANVATLPLSDTLLQALTQALRLITILGFNVFSTLKFRNNIRIA